jgi:hypothetical protein
MRIPTSQVVVLQRGPRILLCTDLIRHRARGKNMRFQQTIFVGLVFANIFLIMDEKRIIQQPKAWSDRYDYERITFIHRVINMLNLDLPCFLYTLYTVYF